jgi:hypothetical protein
MEKDYLNAKILLFSTIKLSLRKKEENRSSINHENAGAANNYR